MIPWLKRGQLLRCLGNTQFTKLAVRKAYKRARPV